MTLLGNVFEKTVFSGDKNLIILLQGALSGITRVRNEILFAFPFILRYTKLVVAWTIEPHYEKNCFLHML